MLTPPYPLPLLLLSSEDLCKRLAGNHELDASVAMVLGQGLGSQEARLLNQYVYHMDDDDMTKVSS